jgi:hypothetical protein
VKASQDEAIDQTPGRQARGDSSTCPPFDERVRKLVWDWGTARSPAPIEEMIITALKIARDQPSMADLKLINRSVKEMRSAAKSHRIRIGANSAEFARLSSGDRFRV